MTSSNPRNWRIQRANSNAGRSDWPRIGIVHSFYRASLPSGENSAVLRQFSILAAHGVDVTLFGIHTDDVITQPLAALRTGISVARGKGFTLPPDYFHEKVDVVHVHNCFPNISHIWLEELALPKLATVHNYRAFCAKGTFSRNGETCFECLNRSPWRALQHSCYQSSRSATLPIVMQQQGPHSWLAFLTSLPLTLVPGQPMRDFLCQLGLKNSQLLPHPTSSAPTHFPSQRRLREEWLFVGRLDVDKGIEDLVKTWPQHESLAIVGDGPLAKRCQEIASHRNLTVNFLGAKSPVEVLKLMRTSFGLIFPSIALEGAPLVYAEAMSAGLPVVAAEGNVLADQVVRDGTGVSFSLGDEESLRGALRQVLEGRRSLSLRCFDVHHERYTEERWLDGLRAAYLSTTKLSESS